MNKIFSFLVLIFSLILLIISYYKSEFVFKGLNNSKYIIFYLFSVFFILVSLTTIIINKKYEIYLKIFIITSIFVLYSFEVFLISQNNKIKKALNINNLENFELNKNDNEKIVTLISPNLFLKKKQINILPLSGISKSKTIFCNENGYYSVYKSDRYGFNNEDNIWDLGKIEYLLIGDSYVHGACVNRKDNISYNLQNISQKPALNLGFSGNGPLINYATLREFSKKNVKNILWFYYEGNDNRNLIDELDNKILLKYFNNKSFSQNIIKNTKNVDTFLRSHLDQEHKKFKKKEKLILFMNFIKLSFIRNTYFTQNTTLPPNEFKTLIQKVKNFSMENNSVLYFIYIPERRRYLSKKYNNKNYELVKTIIEELDLNFIDLHAQEFKKVKDMGKFYPSLHFGHFNEVGYKKISEIIYKSINLKNKLK
jgi:hypothetical protein